MPIVLSSYTPANATQQASYQYQRLVETPVALYSQAYFMPGVDVNNEYRRVAAVFGDPFQRPPLPETVPPVPQPVLPSIIPQVPGNSINQWPILPALEDPQSPIVLLPQPDRQPLPNLADNTVLPQIPGSTPVVQPTVIFSETPETVTSDVVPPATSEPLVPGTAPSEQPRARLSKHIRKLLQNIRQGERRIERLEAQLAHLHTWQDKKQEKLENHTGKMPAGKLTAWQKQLAQVDSHQNRINNKLSSIQGQLDKWLAELRPVAASLGPQNWLAAVQKLGGNLLNGLAGA